MEEAPDWELCKENIVPLKRGRPNIAKFDKSKVLASNDDADNAKEFLHKIEKQIQDDSVSTTELLETYISYYKWVRDTYPSSSEKALKVLEECTYTLNKKDSSNCIKNNIKYVKMWIEYADMVRIPGDIFTFMNSNKIGDKVSLFWIAWAFVAEKAGNHKLTDQIFQKGIKKLAEPKDILQKRYQQFQRRLARHYLNLAENGELNNESENNSAAKNVLSVRSGSSNSVAPTQSSQSSIKSVATKPVANPTSNSTFSVFNDSSQLNNNLLPENSQWRTLGSENQRKKENEGPLMKFGDGGVTNKLVPSAVSAPAVAIFVDPECATQQSTSVIRKEKPQPLQSIRQKLDGVIESISSDPLARHKKVEPVASPIAPKETVHVPEAINPSVAAPTSAGFSIFSEEPKAPVNTASKPSTKSVAAPTSAGFSIFSEEPKASANYDVDEDQMNEDLLNELGILDSEDGTINTRLARKDIDSMFCSPQEIVAPKRKLMNETSIIGGVSLTSTSQPCKHVNNNNSMACDISAIKESSREYSIFGSIAITPASSNKRLATSKPSGHNNYSIIEEDFNISNSM